MSRRPTVLRRASAVSLVVLASSMAPASMPAQSATDKAAKAVERAADKTSKTADRLRSILDRKKKGGGDSSTTAPGGAPAKGERPAAGSSIGPSPAPAAGGGAEAPPSMAVARGSAKVEEMVVAPNEQNMAYYITPKGSHFGAIVAKGSRFAVSYDGVAGPAFDRILQSANGTTMAFSPDGARLGSIGGTDGKYVYMVDGKEVLRIPVVTQPGVTATTRLSFSPNGKHWYAYFYNPAGANARAEPGRAWWDGVPGPVGATMTLTMSPDGERHAYIVEPPGIGQQVLAVDGKLAPTIGGNPVFTTDGAHLFTTRNASPIQGRPVTELLVDGRPIARATNLTVHVPPVGDRVVLVVERGDAQSAAGAYSLVVGGQRIPGSESSGYPNLIFSPDGKRFAAVSGMKGTRQRIVVDGKAGRVYDAIDSLWFSPDSKHVVYTARANAKIFVVTDETESEVGFAAHLNIVPSFTKEGRVGWMAATGQTNAVVVDGKVTPLNPRVGSFDFSFSPDGKRFAYVLGGDVSGQLGGTVHIDHMPGPSSTLRDFEQLRSGDPIRYVWSTDGRYPVNYGYPGTTYGSDFGFIVGDRYLPVGNVARVALPTFTPDAKHFFWLGFEGRTTMRQVWLDGRMVYEFDQQGDAPLKAPGGWLMGEDGTLIFFIQTVDGFKRVRVTPGPENGFEAWLAKGRALK